MCIRDSLYPGTGPSSSEGVRMQLVVATIGRAHGLRGDVAVDLRTDTPEVRFAVGTALQTDPLDAGPLTVARTRSLGDRWFLGFDDVTDPVSYTHLRAHETVLDLVC